jgi:teichuronic acid biosynthesis glycosyltransferase TuaC
MNLLTFTSLWPNAEQPNFGVFVKHRALAMAQQPGVNMRVVAPVPYFPRAFQAEMFPAHWRRLARVADRELIGGLETFHPRYLVTPKVGMSFYGSWMARATEALVRRLHAAQPIDFIDAHYLYPDGYAAALLSARLRLPLVITARGTDVNLFTQMPLIRPLLRRALQQASGVIAVSESLRQGMLELGIAPEKIVTISNGIDRAVFYPRDRAAARQRLNLDAQAPIIVSVGALVPRKGMACLIDALALVAEKNARLYIIGTGGERAALAARIGAHGLQDRGTLVGARPQAELADWYAAADLFCLASEGEGCPNVVIEALACGVPVVATNVGNIGEMVMSNAYGHVLPTGTAEGFATAINAALATTWDREKIAAHGGARAWNEVAQDVLCYFADLAQLGHRVQDKTAVGISH